MELRGGFRPAAGGAFLTLPSLQEGLRSGEGPSGEAMLSPCSPTRLAHSLASHHLAGADDPVYPTGADGAYSCTALLPGPGRALLCPFFSPLPGPASAAVRSQPLSVRQALLLATHGPRLVLMPGFLPSPYAPYAHTHTRANTCTYTRASARARTGMSDTS